MHWACFASTDGAKEVYTVVGRRGGKSFISAIVGVFVACLCSFKEYLTTASGAWF